MDEPANDSNETNPVKRWALLISGCAFTALAAVGAFLPVLPTTPFLIVAAACFARSSPHLHQRLLANRIFGQYIRQWQHDHTIPREAKRKAYGLLVVSFTLSVVLVQVVWVRWLLVGIGLTLLVLLRLQPTTPRESREE